jgi:hypothetical protein
MTDKSLEDLAVEAERAREAYYGILATNLYADDMENRSRLRIASDRAYERWIAADNAYRRARARDDK